MTRKMRPLGLLALALTLLAGPALAATSPPPVIQTQTLGAKLRQAAQIAAISNPITADPWTIATAWAPSTAYIQSNVVSNSGHLYINLNTSCTSAGSGGPTQVTSVPSTDNTCSWMYYGEQQITASDAMAPTVTTSTGGNVFGSGSTVTFIPTTWPSLYKVYGATPVTLFTDYWRSTAFNDKSGRATAYGYKICADVTDGKFAIVMSSGGPNFAVIIDGRYYSLQARVTPAGTPNNTIFDFTGTTGFRTRNICVVGLQGGVDFGGFATTNAGMVSYPKVPLEVKAAFLWDSYDAGSSYGPFASPGVLSTQIGMHLGWTTTGMGTGGTGIQATAATCSTTCYNYQQRAADTGNAATLAAQNVILFNVSTNDAGLSGEAAAVTTLLTTLRRNNPTALLIGVGPAPLNNGPTYAQSQALDTAGAAGFAAFSDPAGTGRKCYIPVTNDPVPWYTHSAETGVPSNADSKATVLSNGDNVHPGDLGIKVQAQWLAGKIAGCFAAVP